MGRTYTVGIFPTQLKTETLLFIAGSTSSFASQIRTWCSEVVTVNLENKLSKCVNFLYVWRNHKHANRFSLKKSSTLTEMGRLIETLLVVLSDLNTSGSASVVYSISPTTLCRTSHSASFAGDYDGVQ